MRNAYSGVENTEEKNSQLVLRNLLAECDGRNVWIEPVMLGNIRKLGLVRDW